MATGSAAPRLIEQNAQELARGRSTGKAAFVTQTGIALNLRRAGPPPLVGEGRAVSCDFELPGLNGAALGEARRHLAFVAFKILPAFNVARDAARFDLLAARGVVGECSAGGEQHGSGGENNPVHWKSF